MKKLTGSFDDELTPAYGRDYKSKAQACTDFKAGKDFKLARTGQLCSIRDFVPGCTVIIRYGRLMKVCTLALTKEV